MPIKNRRMTDNVWLLPETKGAVEDHGPLLRGQELRVDCTEDGFDFIPCFPKPGTKETITRVPNGAWIIYLGTVEFNGATCLEFITKEDEKVFFLGTGALPYLLNIPQRRIRKGHPFRKKSGSKTGKGGVRRKPHGRRKRPGEGLINLANGKTRTKKDRKKR